MVEGTQSGQNVWWRTQEWLIEKGREEKRRCEAMFIASSGAMVGWALNELKKPIVTYEWLKQCSEEHRVVPQESYKVLPFSGLKICVTGIPADVRKEMEKLILQNGGKYSAELTKNCTHLISDISFL
ncbi:unnamed protein product [Sphenostylis stenocarpa]|uniref:BRCT domain-containing protein n=1 Tax=Sphenostylis stenocarpa TaxID=92480 RepID=A0AA86TLF3_9FABA|nr:unnamed protein product [Sphenostylis stenocarpa]